jgi:FSR family fosmidomycin resistance protein-like MFS transporter
VGPLLAAFIVLPHGQSSVGWFSLTALLGMFVLFNVGHWYKTHGMARLKARSNTAAPLIGSKQVAGAVAVLLALIFSKYFYMASLTSYYTFYLIHRFNVSVQSAQLHLFVFLAAVAVGTIIGGPLGDRLGRKYIIWVSILGVLPFTLLLPHANLLWTSVLTVPIGIILASAFPAIVVYAQELMPGRTGTVAGLFFGFAFGMGGIGAAVLGKIADAYGIVTVYDLCAFLPLIGLLAALLPDVEHRRARALPA